VDATRRLNGCLANRADAPTARHPMAPLEKGELHVCFCFINTNKSPMLRCEWIQWKSGCAEKSLY
jgi:hypothetical protein